LKISIFKKYLKYFLFAFFSVLVISELFLRWYGLNDLPTYRVDPDYEYIHNSNQQRVIYRNEFFTNSLGLRSDKIDEKKRKILLIGDSVLNGGTKNSNKELASSLIQTNLDDSIQVLNISSGSWGPDNGMQFIKKHGDFDALLICLVFNSHDAGDIMDFRPEVGVNPFKPGENDFFALVSFSKRFILPKLKFNKKKKSNQPSMKNPPVFNPGWDFFYDYCKEHKIQLIVYLHAEKNELYDGKYSKKGEEIVSFCRDKNIRLVQDINHLKSNFFSDGIHLNQHGQKMLADLLIPEIAGILKEKTSQFQPEANY